MVECKYLYLSFVSCVIGDELSGKRRGGILVSMWLLGCGAVVHFSTSFRVYKLCVGYWAVHVLLPSTINETWSRHFGSVPCSTLVFQDFKVWLVAVWEMLAYSFFLFMFAASIVREVFQDELGADFAARSCKVCLMKLCFGASVSSPVFIDCVLLFIRNSCPGCSDENLHDLLLAFISWHGMSIFALVYVRNRDREGVAYFESWGMWSSLLPREPGVVAVDVDWSSGRHAFTFFLRSISSLIRIFLTSSSE